MKKCAFTLILINRDYDYEGNDYMIYLSVTNFSKDIYSLLSHTIKFNEPINIKTKDGNAVIISEENYNGLIETLYLSSIPEVKASIIEGLKTPLDHFILEDEVEW